MPSIYQTTTSTEVSRLVRLSYLQTIAALDNSNILGNLAGVSEGRSNNFSSSDPGSPGFLGIGAEGASSVSSSFTDSGWAISRTWLETYWDKIRWAIGIKELGLFSYKYSEVGEIVSAEFRFPAIVKKVSLKVDEIIPNKYPGNQKWIQYFVSHNNGLNWYRINPIDSSSNLSGQSFIPRILNFNSQSIENDTDNDKFITTDKPVNSLRFKAILLRPPGEEFERTSPILKSYRMITYVEDDRIEV